MKTQKRLGFWQAFLSVILESCVAMAMGISSREAASILRATSGAERRGAGEVQRAQRIRTTFSLDDSVEAVSRICRYLDGLPLGIELAAGLLRVLPVEDIAEQIKRDPEILATTLRDIPARHQSLRAVFEHSWSLLTADERTALMNLSVFRGSFRREAADAVAGASFPMLLALVDKSLVRLTPSGRYDLHDLLHQFVEEKLRATARSRETVQERHSSYYADFVYQRQGRLERDADRKAIEQIEEDIDNVRAAWAWAVTGERVRNGCLHICQQGESIRKLQIKSA